VQAQQVTPAPVGPARSRRRWRRPLVIALVVVGLVTGVVLYGAYGYRPPEAGRAWRSAYLRVVPSRFVGTPVARFHYVHAGKGSPMTTALGGRDAWSWEILKYPVVGELLTNLLGTRKSTVRSALEQTPVHRDRLTDELVDEAWAPLTFHDNLEATYRLERGLDWSQTERALPSTRTPTLVVWGRQDKIVPVRQAPRLGQLLPDAQVQLLDQCGHAVMLDCPGQVNALLAVFLGQRQ
jgi:pimeloyl-ACP methyl ester carboxylesterase